jgi:ABC-type nitrate/sulfonate/bicarbonate transport system substrate-binding protein
MGTGTRAIGVCLVVMLPALFVLGGCGLFTGNPPSGRTAPERTTLRVGVGSPVDTAPLRTAVADGSFGRAGLQVDLVEEASPEDGLAKLAAGELDVAFGTDVALFKAAAAGTALQLQGEAYTSATATMGLMTLPGSRYLDPGAKKNPVIAVDTLDDLGTLTVTSMLGTAGVDPSKIKFVRQPFAQMPAALRDGGADAAWMVEPFLTEAAKDLGAHLLVDSSRGATLDFPVSSYASSGLFAQSNPRTLSLFRQVLGDAQLRAGNQTLVRQALARSPGIDELTASLVALGSYPSSLNGVRLQRVADLMHNSGLLGGRLDVQSLLPKSDLP